MKTKRRNFFKIVGGGAAALLGFKTAPKAWTSEPIRYVDLKFKEPKYLIVGLVLKKDERIYWRAFLYTDTQEYIEKGKNIINEIGDCELIRAKVSKVYDTHMEEVTEMPFL